jgi:chromosome segregation ATPase
MVKILAISLLPTISSSLTVFAQRKVVLGEHGGTFSHIALEFNDDYNKPWWEFHEWLCKFNGFSGTNDSRLWNLDKGFVVTLPDTESEVREREEREHEDRVRQESDDRQIFLDEMYEKIRNSEGELNSLRCDVNKRNGDLSFSNDKVKSLETALNSTNEEISRREQCIDQIWKGIEKQEGHLNFVRGEVSNKRDYFNRLSQDIEGKENYLKGLWEKAGECQKNLDRVNDLVENREDHFRCLGEELGKREGHLNFTNSSITDSEDHLKWLGEEWSRKYDCFNAANEEIFALEREISQTNTKIKDDESSLNCMTNKINIERNEEEIQRKIKYLDNIKDEISHKEDQLNKLVFEANLRKGKLKEICDENLNIRKDLDSISEEIDQKRQNINQIIQENSNGEKHLNSINNKFLDYKNEETSSVKFLKVEKSSDNLLQKLKKTLSKKRIENQNLDSRFENESNKIEDEIKALELFLPVEFKISDDVNEEMVF